MQKPSVEYTVSEVRDYFKDEIKSLKNELAYKVTNNIMTAEEARKKYDMFLNCYELLNVLRAKEQQEEWLNDRTFSLREIYKETTSDAMLSDIAKRIG